MAYLNSSNAKTRWIAESAWGVTPTNPILGPIETLPGTTFAANLNKQLGEGHRGDALTREMYMVGKDWTGNIAMYLRPSFDIFKFLSAVCRDDGVAKFDILNANAIKLKNTIGTSGSFDITIDSAAVDWVDDYKAHVGAWVGLVGTGLKSAGRWKITAIKTATNANDTITVTGDGATSVVADAVGTAYTALFVMHAEAGITDTSFTFEEDRGGSNYIAWTGGYFNSASIEIPEQGVSTVTFGMIGKGIDTDGVTIGSGVRGNVYNNAPAYHNNNLDLTLDIGGTPFTGCVVSAGLNIENGYRILPGACAGVNAAAIMNGRFNVTGSISIYFEDFVEYEKALDHDKVSLTLSIWNGETDTQSTFLERAFRIGIPKCYYTAPELSPAEIEANPIVTLPFQAVADSNGDIINLDFNGYFAKAINVQS